MEVPTPTAPVVASLSIAVASDGFVVGELRVPFVVFGAENEVVSSGATHVVVYPVGQAAGEPTWQGEAAGYPDYSIPYWVARPEIPHSGLWALTVSITLPDGSVERGQFAIEVQSSNHSPQVGQEPPASANRTLATVPDLAQLTSDPDPNPDFYRLTVAEAMRSGQPTVVVFATPAFCTSRLCAPVLNSAKSVEPKYRGEVNFIHIEVYKSFDPLVYADEMGSWGLTSEPWTFVLDAEGTVRSRLGGPVSPQELEDALRSVLGS